MSKANTPTPHNAAKYGDIAEKMIMAGDPLRVKYIAENFLENPVLYNTVRGMFGYTGTYKGKRVSVQGHGMGIPSMAIYSSELLNFYDVKRIIRIGTCGTMNADVNLGTLIVAQNACTDSNYGYQFGLPFGTYTPCADFEFVKAATEKIKENGHNYQVGTILSTDVFYDPSGKQLEWSKFGVLAAEMEVYALYLNAIVAKKQALAICTVTDNMITHEGLSAQMRQQGLNDMIKIALEII